MSEIAARYVSVYPRIATGFSTEINAAVGKGVSGGGKALGVGMEKAAKDVAPKIATKFTSVLTPIFTGVGIMAVTRFVKSSVDSFNQFEDASDAAAVTFGSAMKKVDALAATSAKTLGMSKTATIEAATSFGVYANSAGLAGDSAADFSIELTRLGADMASFKGTSPERAIEAIGAALRGEMEPIRYFGVTLDDASLRARALKDGLIATTKEALTPQQKILAAHALILEKTTFMQGNFNDTAELGANVSKTLEATSADLAAEIGGKLQPAIMSAQKAGIGLIDWAIQNEAMLTPLAKALGTVTLAVGGLVATSKGIEALKAAKATISGIGDAFQQMSTKAKIATASAGAVGIALTAGALIYGHFAQKNADAAAAVAEFTKAVEADTGALGENTRAAIENQLQTNGMLEAATKMGISSEALTDAMMGSSTAVEYVNRKLDEYQSANAAVSNRNTGLVAEVSQIRDGMGDMAGQIGQAQAAYADYQREAGGAKKSTEENAGAVKDGKLAYQDYTKAINGSYNAQLKLAGSEIAAEAAIDEGAERIKEWTAELTRKYEEEIKATAAAKGRKISDEDAAKQAEKRAKKEVDAAIKSGEALDINTDAGRKNKEALLAIADTTLAAMEGMTDLEKANGTAADRADRGREEFIKLADSFGVGKEEAEALADQMGLLKSKQIDFRVNVTWSGNLSKYVTLEGGGGNRQTKRAGGGAIRGPGTGTSDGVPILASNGEWVIKEKSARYYGPAVMDAINQGRIPREAFAGKYASGGPVMPTYKGHSLDYWEDYLLTDLETTRLQIRIKDLKANLAEKETYYTGKGKKRKKKSRQKLRDLERTEAQLELGDAQEQLRLSTEAAKANAGAAGTIADQIARYETALKISEDAASSWQSAAASLGKGSGISVTGSYKSSRDAAGNLVYTGTGGFDAASFLAQKSAEGDTVLAFVSKLDRLRDLGAPKRLVDDIMALGAIEGSRVADAFLADPATLAGAQSAYGKLVTAEEQMQAIGAKAASAAISITTVNPVAEPTSVTIAKALQYAAAAGVI